MNLNSVIMLLLGILLTAVVSLLLTRRSEKVAASLKAAEALESVRDKRDRRIEELERQLALVVQAQLPISAAFQALLVKELTHFHTPVLDELLKKLGPPYTLSAEEEMKLIYLLTEREKEAGSLLTESEREAATMLPMVIRRVKSETALGIGVTEEPI